MDEIFDLIESVSEGFPTYCCKEAGEKAKIKGQNYKQHYDQHVRSSVLETGDRVLVSKVGITGKHKLADILGIMHILSFQKTNI